MKTLIKSIYALVLLVVITSCSKDDDTVVPETPVATLSSISPTSGPKTTIVTINGNHFGDDPSKIQVYFNDVEAEVQSVENTKIITTVPPRAYTGIVKVMVNGTELEGPEFDYVITDVLVSTFAGSTYGDEDGTGTNAKLETPTSGVFDSQGNLFVVDNGNHKIKKITPQGVVTTFAGSATGSSGDSDGTGTNAEFSYPMGIAIDGQDNLYVADQYNRKVRKITPSGVVSTFAGGTYGDEDGTGTNAKFKQPFGITVDSENNIYVSDRWSNKIKRITPEGVVTTLAGSTAGNTDGVGNTAQFNYPSGLTIDNQDNIYVADASNHSIRKITASGTVTTIAGSIQGYENGDALSAKFNEPVGLAIDERGIIYIVDYTNLRIRKIGTDGQVSTLAGQATSGNEDGTGANARFNGPYGICINAEGDLYIADSNNNRIRKITQE